MSCVRKIDCDGNYLKKQSVKYLGWAFLCLLFFILIFSLTSYCILFRTRTIGVVEAVGFVVSLVGLGMFRYYQRKYYIYKSGRQGEKAVINTLGHSLSDDYYLINGVYLKGGGGDVDHIVLGPSGVYVLETKNWSGRIICNGDQWQRTGKKIKSNPSLQVKRNAQKVRKIIDASSAFRGFNIWVEGLLVFTNAHADLSISNPSVTIIRLTQLSNYVKNHENNCLTKEQVQKLVKQFQNM